MYNLMVQGGGWPLHRSNFTGGRIFEYTEAHIAAGFRANGAIDLQRLIQLPTLFMPEQNSGDNLARVGTITRATHIGRGDVGLEYSYDHTIMPLSVDFIAEHSNDLQIEDFEFHRTHWAVKETDLFRTLFRSVNARHNTPTVFRISETPAIDDRLMSAMMPFGAGFAGVYAAIQTAGQRVGLTVNRADNIWEHAHIIQDIVSLIDRSRIVVADCTDRNANVFYEVGIAHALGREVILITQNLEFIPFDLRHHRAVIYQNNGEGHEALTQAIADRAHTILYGAR